MRNMYQGKSMGQVNCAVCGNDSEGRDCSHGCRNGRRHVVCYICLNTDSTWSCGCQGDAEERAAALAAGLGDEPSSIREERRQGRLRIRPGRHVVCYICLNTDSTWGCGCQGDAEERAAALAAGLGDEPSSIREERRQGNLRIRPGHEYDGR